MNFRILNYTVFFIVLTTLFIAGYRVINGGGGYERSGIRPGLVIEAGPVAENLPLPIEDPALPEPEIEDEKEILPPPAPVKTEGGRYVYLTFDDGPSQNTHRILDILDAHDIQGTFFFVGNHLNAVSSSSAILERLLQDGHYIGLHSMTHRHDLLYQGASSYQTFYQEMREVQNLIYEMSGYRSNLCRAPFGTWGTFSQNHIDKITDSDLSCWDWHVDTRDWAHSNVAAIMDEVHQNMAFHEYPDHVVVLLHELDITVAVLPYLIRYFQEMGYTFLAYHPENHFAMNLHQNPDL